VIDDLDDFVPGSIFVEGRDQVVIGIKVTPVYGQLELSLLASVVDSANEHGFSLARYEAFRDDYLLCLFETYDDEAEG
jgi:hypothetical protein